MRRFLLSLAIVSFAFPAAAQEEAPKAKPSIVVDAKDDQGHDLRSVTVFVDDRAVAYELTTIPIDVEPGPHTITLQRNDGPRQRVSTNVTLAEGDENHAVHVVFERPAAEAPPLEAPLNAPLAPRIIAGVGVAGVITGVVLLLVRPAMPTNCDPDTSRCTKLPAQTDAQFEADRQDAGDNRTFLGAGLATLIGGAALTGVGVAWYILERKPFETTKPRALVGPWLRSEAGGVTFRAAF